MVLQQLQALKAQQQSGFAVLADPDKTAPAHMTQLARLCNDAGVTFLLMGGSLLMAHQMEQCIQRFRAESTIPIVLFPGSPAQVSPSAQALLYLSLLSGRNADLLIGQHVASAPQVKASGLEVVSTGYILVDGGVATTVQYMSNTQPIPADKPDIALCTAWAGEMQGKHIIYLDAGSGARRPVPEAMIRKVSSNIGIPLVVGGGICDAERVYTACAAGANLVVVGNAIERDPLLIRDMAQATRAASASRSLV